MKYYLIYNTGNVLEVSNKWYWKLYAWITDSYIIEIPEDIDL